jgi:hypothetical protein
MSYPQDGEIEAMVKPRENRVPIMMSDEELTAIDDWRYANRVATRSDAVRRLVQVALRYLEHLNAYVAAEDAHIFKLLDWQGVFHDAIDNASGLERLKNTVTLSVFDNLDPIVDLQLEAHEILGQMVEEASAVLDAPTVPDGIAAADVRRQIGKQQMAELREQIEAEAKERQKAIKKVEGS